MFKRLFRRSKSDLLPSPFFLQGRTDVIFVHVTKTAGTSIRKSLKLNRTNLSESFKKHYFASEIIQLIGQERWDKAFTFTFVRNPWDRLFSHYRFKMRKQNTTDMVSIDHFQEWSLKKIHRSLMTTDPTLWKNLKPQSEFLYNQDGQIAIDFIGRFENLEADFQTLCQKIGIKAQLSHFNHSLPILKYRDFYQDELKSLVEHYYADDIENFAYTF